MAQIPQINIQLRTTWIMLAFRFFSWLESSRLLRVLDNCIFARIYVDGEFKNELRFNISDKNHINIRGDFPGGKIKEGSDINL